MNKVCHNRQEYFACLEKLSEVTQLFTMNGLSIYPTYICLSKQI